MLLIARPPQRCASSKTSREAKGANFSGSVGPNSETSLVPEAAMRWPPPLSAATPAQVVEAMRTGPGRMPVFGPQQVTDDQATSIARYVQYLQHPNDRGGASLGHLGPVPEGLVAWVLGLGAAVFLCRWLGTRGA